MDNDRFSKLEEFSTLDKEIEKLKDSTLTMLAAITMLIKKVEKIEEVLNLGKSKNDNYKERL